MKIQRNWFVATALLLPLPFVVFSVGALASPAVASDPTYSFDLTGTQTEDPSTHNTVALTGAGSFDPSARTVVASGAFGATPAVHKWSGIGSDEYNVFICARALSSETPTFNLA
jgi:hypothetical protein